MTSIRGRTTRNMGGRASTLTSIDIMSEGMATSCYKIIIRPCIKGRMSWKNFLFSW
jgi:hypothetical protein